MDEARDSITGSGVGDHAAKPPDDAVRKVVHPARTAPVSMPGMSDE